MSKLRFMGAILALTICCTPAQGQLQISYADSNNRVEFIPHAMYVKQNGGPSVFNATPTVNGDAAPQASVTDPMGDAGFDANGLGSRVNIEATVYEKRITNLLLSRALERSAGFRLPSTRPSLPRGASTASPCSSCGTSRMRWSAYRGR